MGGLRDRAAHHRIALSNRHRMLRSIVMARSALNPRLRSLACWIASALSVWGGITLESDGYHVRPGDRIQDALDQAATNAVQKTVWVHAGTYRPESKRQALVWFNVLKCRSLIEQKV